MNDLWMPFFSVIVFVAVVLVVQVVAHTMYTSRDQNKRVNRRLTMLASGMEKADVYAALVRAPTLQMEGNGFIARNYNSFAALCQHAGLQIAPLRLLAIFAAAALGLWVFSIFLLQRTGMSTTVENAAIALVASSVVAWTVAWIWLFNMKTRRLKALEEQLPLALDVINRALRAGHPVVSAVQLASDELGDPIGSEFGLIVDETTYGYEFKDALVNFAKRTDSPDARFFAVSVGIQSETGGNLAEVLEGLARVMRGRFMLGKRVKALSSEGRASAMILSALPLFLVAFMMMTHPAFYTEKFSDPIFWPTVGSICALYFIGWLMIRRIINFRY